MAAPPPSPVLGITRFDRVSSWLIALVCMLGLSVGGLTVVWAALRPTRRIDPVPVEILEIPGGVEDGSIEETLQLDSPAPESADASLAEVDAPENEIQETLDNVMELADEATNQADRQFEFDARNAGKAGSAKGTGRRALGMGPGEKGLPREQRWFIGYSDSVGLDEYARQLDFFGVELGALFPDGQLVYLSGLSQPNPAKRTVTGGGSEQRLYMIWQGGGRRKADAQLIVKGGVSLGNGAVLQFYPPNVEQTLAQLEKDYRNRDVEQIRRTYFAVRTTKTGYEFYVTRQVYFE